MGGAIISEPGYFLSGGRFLYGMLEALAFLTLSATILGFFGRFWYFFDLMAHFRWQYAVALLAFALLAGLMRRWKSLGLALIGAGINGALLLPWFLPPAAPAANPTEAFRVVSWNLLLHNRQAEAGIDELARLQPDLMFLMEVNRKWRERLEARFGEDYLFTYEEREDNFGVALLSRLPGSEARIREFGPANVPSIVVRANWQGRPFEAVFTHPLPPANRRQARQRNEQLEEVARWIQERKNETPLLVAGDFNATPWSWIYRDFVQKTGLSNAAIGYGCWPTWSAGIPGSELMIDHLFVSGSWRVERLWIGPSSGSDHRPVVADLRW